jgi:DNA excision repair protein ERCC-2
MSEQLRLEFIDQLRTHRGVVGFAVLGGAFSEGIDLPGDTYTYLYPGIRKVIQAAGRLIRTPEDKGVVELMDDRFGSAEVQGLLPGWWFETIDDS